MGMAKRWLEEMDSREFGEVEEKYACLNCFGDIGLQKYIKTNGGSGECSYCKEENEYVVSLEDLLYHIQSSLRTEYPSPENSGITYISREGGWQIEPIDVYDIFAHESLEENNDAIDDVINYLDENLYSPKLYSDEDRMSELWYHFTYHIMHKSRFLFDDGSDDYDGEEWRDSRNMPYKIAEIITEKQLFTEIKIDEELYRVRLSKNLETMHNAKSLGTVPQEYAIYENRMSPAGIPMFYGAKDLKTAILEVFDENAAIYHNAIFKPSRTLRLVDLTSRVNVPSIYDEDERHLRAKYIFLNDFIKNISKPITKDEVQHLHYLPTQIITEFLRYQLKYDGQPIDGIMYKSSKAGAKLSFVLFVENKNCVEKDSKLEDDELYLICQSIESGIIKRHIQPANEPPEELYQLHFTIEKK